MRLIFLILFTSITRTVLSSPFIWVANFTGNTVSVIDAATNQLVTLISQSEGMFDGPYSLAFTPDGSFAYVGNNIGDTVSVINTTTFQLVTLIPLSGALNNVVDVEVSPAGDLVMTANSNSGRVSVISTATNTEIATLTTHLGSPQWIAFSADGTLAYVTNGGLGNIAVINTAALTVSQPSGLGLGSMVYPYSIAIAPNGEYAYVTSSDIGLVYIVNLLNNTVSGSIPIVTTPGQVVFASDGATAYVADNINISVINTSNQSVTQITAGINAALFLAISSSQRLYATNQGTDDVAVFSTVTLGLLDTITTAEGSFNDPLFIRFQPEPAASTGQRPFQRPLNRRPR